MDHFRQKAQSQLGTVGSGNHYVDVFVDQDEHIWIGVHFGSRGLGHKSASRFLELAGGKDGMDCDPTLLEVESDLGRQYLSAMELAGYYAYAGRNWVVERVRQIIGGEATYHVYNHHNYAWIEEHEGRNLYVVRKGATPAWPGQKGFVGGSMGDDAVILEGVDTPQARESLYSTVHGAGRVMGRKEALGRTNTIAKCTECEFQVPWEQYEKARKKAGLKEGAQFNLCPDHPAATMKKQKLRLPGKIRHDEMQAWLKEKGVILIGGGLDEAPQAYRRLPDVLAEHGDTIKILYTLKPLIVVMAGDKEFDPYKD